jgi:tetratricopeptide (TPR) repeat protein
LIADIYIQQEQTDYALRSLERAVSKAQGTANTQAEANILVKLGLLQKELGREAEASSAFQRAAASDPQSWQAQYHLGVSYLEVGQAQNAISPLEQARAINAESPEVYLALTMAYEQTGRSNEVLSTAETALSLLEDPLQIAQVKATLGRVYFYQGNYQDALSAFEEVLESQSDDALSQLWAGLAEYQLEDYDMAVEYLEQAVQLDSESVEARANLGAAYYQAKRYQDAELVYQLILEESPNDAEAYYNLGLALMAQSQPDAAKEAWQKASELQYSPAQDALQRYF